jgi:hypothetical protein
MGRQPSKHRRAPKANLLSRRILPIRLRSQLLPLLLLLLLLLLLETKHLPRQLLLKLVMVQLLPEAASLVQRSRSAELTRLAPLPKLIRQLKPTLRQLVPRWRGRT